MNTVEDVIILQGHVYQHNKKKIDNRTLQTHEIKKFPLSTNIRNYQKLAHMTANWNNRKNWLKHTSTLDVLCLFLLMMDTIRNLLIVFNIELE